MSATDLCTCGHGANAHQDSHVEARCNFCSCLQFTLDHNDPIPKSGFLKGYEPHYPDARENLGRDLNIIRLITQALDPLPQNNIEAILAYCTHIYGRRS